MPRAAAAVLIAIGACAPTTSSDSGSREPARPAFGFVDSLLDARFTDSAPGVSIAVTRDGRLLYEAVRGLAELETGRPIHPETPFYLASVAKPFTAAAVAALVAQGSLALDAPVGEYVGGLPPQVGDATIRQLLTHTSGVPDYYQFLDWQAFRGLTNAGVLDTLRAHPTPTSPAGTRFEYSNSNYVLLAEAVAAASREPYAVALRRLVLAPSGATSAFAYETAVLRAPERALGYRESEHRFVPMDYMAMRLADGATRPLGFATVGAGGLYATAADVARFADAVFGGRIVEAAAADTLVPGAPPPVTRGSADECPYGFGWHVCTRWGDTIVMHDGGFVGFSSAVLHARDHRLTVAVLTNRASGKAQDIALEIARRLLHE